MDLYDQHLHSRHSFDSQADPAGNVRAALDRRLAGLTFTEHFDTHPEDWKTCTYDDAAYSATIATLRETFGDAIFIGKGIEVCFQPDRMDYVLDFLGRHTFDLVILSVHYFGEHPVHHRRHWSDLDVATGTRRYLENVLRAVRFCESLHRSGDRVFDVLGHIDLVKRYTQRFLGSYDVSPCGELIEEILRTCLAADLTPEINTSSLRQGLRETMPGAGTIARYASLGGTAISLGSDAHRSEDIGVGLADAAGMAHASGVGSLAVFRGREPHRVEITGR